MSDPRVSGLADLLVRYSLRLQPGKTVRIDSSEDGVPLAREVYRAALEVGAHPYTQTRLEGLAELLVSTGSEEQLVFVSELQEHEADAVDAIVTIWGDSNTRSFSQADPARYSRYQAARRALGNRFWERISRGEADWVGTQFPTAAHAQDAAMSLAEYEEFVYGACHVGGPEDPVSHWEGVAAELEAWAGELAGVRELRIVGPDTDLRLGVEGRRWLTACGLRNMPDGEVFTSPVEEATEGEIRFVFPAIYNGREVEDVRLRFEGGSVVSAEAGSGGDYLRSLLDIDDDAKVAGEFAFGLNYEIDRFTSNILFDEKIGGTVHLALGSGFPEAGGRARSGLHWDLICDLREDGEIYADGELVWRAGRFLAASASEPAVAATG
jgi:aminopeptidase